VEAKGYTLRPAAKSDLEAIWDYTAQTWSAAQAETYVRKLFNAFDLLVANPDIARERTEYSPPVHIYRAEQHVIIYHIVANTIEIIRVRHGREDWQSSPEK
jgi:toxin ParE1/3/4